MSGPIPPGESWRRPCLFLCLVLLMGADAKIALDENDTIPGEALANGPAHTAQGLWGTSRAASGPREEGICLY